MQNKKDEKTVKNRGAARTLTGKRAFPHNFAVDAAKKLLYNRDAPKIMTLFGNEEKEVLVSNMIDSAYEITGIFESDGMVIVEMILKRR